MNPTTAPTVRATHRWSAHVLVAGLGLVAALLLRAPVVAVLVAPSVLLVGAAIAWSPGATPGGRVRVGADRLLPGDTTDATVEVDGAPAAGAAVRLAVGGPLQPLAPTAATVVPDADGGIHLEVALRADRWGAAAVGPVQLQWWSPGRLLEAAATVGEPEHVRILPRTPAAETLVHPRRTHVAHGVQRATVTGEGTEFADLRPFVAGDRARDVSPRVSARRGAPWVVERHPDRRTDIVLLLDAYEPGELDHVLTAARALARGHLQVRDRVGVTTLTGVVRWLAPGDGPRHEHRIAEALLDARVAHSWVRPAVEELPPRVLPPGALVLGVTPGSDPRLAEVAMALRARGRDVAVVVLEPPSARLPGVEPAIEAAARRLLALRRRAVRDRLHLHGVPAVAWDPTSPVDAALRDLAAWRRQGRRRAQAW